MGRLEAMQANAMRALIPPPRLRLSDWIEKEIRLPEGVSAQPGRVRLWPFQREIADAIGDPMIERVTLVKPVRVGFTTLLTAALAGYVANEPAPILFVLPAEADCRDFMVSDLEPIFAESPAVADTLADDAERNTLLSRRFPGGSLKIVAARAPRNLRRHTARVLFLDEADGMESTPEGSPVLLAERRTLSFPDRKIVMGSTPVHEETSHVLRSYAQSDMRVFETPCPECGEFHEIMWPNITWPPGEPHKAAWSCPGCGSVIEEKHKAHIVAQGRWRATAPEVKGHAGFRLNALVSLHANASWGKLAAEFVAAKDDPTTLQTFVNTILGQGWRGEGDELDESDLAARAEAWGLDAVPADVLAITAGVDVQHDRLEITLIGWAESGTAYVLGHRVTWGAWGDEGTWRDLDELLRQRFPHAMGGLIGIDAACIDAGDGTTTRAVQAFCGPRLRRKVFAIKGAGGNRPVIERAGSKTKAGNRLWIVGVDTAKGQLFGRAARGETLKFSADLPAVWFEQFASERAVIRYRKGQPSRSFERIRGRAAEALDCCVYAMAARQMIAPDWTARRAALTGEAPPPVRAAPVLQSSWMARG
mgnify:CR=1 FL=1